MLKILHNYVHGDVKTQYLLQHTCMLFLPIINYDGYIAINHAYVKTGVMQEIRKNQNAYTAQGACDKTSIGVDLNRNYGFKWGNDDAGSSGEANVCGFNYRGPKAFSEPETAAVKAFVERWHNIKIALNLHTYDNTLNNPFNYDNQGNKLLRE